MPPSHPAAPSWRQICRDSLRRRHKAACRSAPRRRAARTLHCLPSPGTALASRGGKPAVSQHGSRDFSGSPHHRPRRLSRGAHRAPGLRPLERQAPRHPGPTRTSRTRGPLAPRSDSHRRRAACEQGLRSRPRHRQHTCPSRPGPTRRPIDPRQWVPEGRPLGPRLATRPVHRWALVLPSFPTRERPLRCEEAANGARRREPYLYPRLQVRKRPTFPASLATRPLLARTVRLHPIPAIPGSAGRSCAAANPCEGSRVRTQSPRDRRDQSRARRPHGVRRRLARHGPALPRSITALRRQQRNLPWRPPQAVRRQCRPVRPGRWHQRAGSPFSSTSHRPSPAGYPERQASNRCTHPRHQRPRPWGRPGDSPRCPLRPPTDKRTAVRAPLVRQRPPLAFCRPRR